jgi:PAS domain S-box-containing protein
MDTPLEDSEARFQSIFEGSAIGIALVGMDGHPQRCNAALLNMLGYSEAELQAMAFADFTHPDDVAIDIALFGELLRGARDQYHIEKRYIRKDGSVVWARLSVSALRDSTGAPACLIGMAEDVTAERLAHAERERLLYDLHQSDERLKLALEASAMGIWEWDFTTNSVTWSEQLERIAGMAVGSFPGTIEAFWTLVHKDDRVIISQALGRAVDDPSSGGAFESEFRLARADGSLRWIACSGRVLRDQSGRAARMVGMAHDISGMRQLELQFQQAQKMDAMGRLAGGIAHDFNNLLTAILGYSELVFAALPAGDALGADVQEIANAAKRAAALTNQLLAFSRSQVLAPKVLNPNEVVGTIENMLRRLIGEDIEVRVALTTAPCAVRVDPGQLEQVIVNLAVNARDAMPHGGTLTIETSVAEFDERLVQQRTHLAPGRYTVLSVSDTGTGMTPDVKARLFEPFFTTKEKGRGTGLGLATVYGIVQQSGGAIWVYSEPHQGATFKVYLPWVSERPDGVTTGTAATPSVGGTETIVLVDDDAQVRALSERALRAQGYEVFAFDTGLDAAEFVKTAGSGTDLLITDVVMPHMQGPELANDVRATRPGARVLYMTGYTDRAIEPGGLPNILHKPFTPTTLIQTVRDVLDRPFGVRAA